MGKKDGVFDRGVVFSRSGRKEKEEGERAGGKEQIRTNAGFVRSPLAHLVGVLLGVHGHLLLRAVERHHLRHIVPGPGVARRHLFRFIFSVFEVVVPPQFQSRDEKKRVRD
jgi:hypothetical protein